MGWALQADARVLVAEDEEVVVGGGRGGDGDGVRWDEEERLTRYRERARRLDERDEVAD